MPDQDETFEFANQELIALLQELAEQETHEKRGAFHQKLLGSQLLLPAPDDDGADDDELHEDIPLLTFENDAGASVLVAFTDEDAALAWAPDDTEFVVLRGLDLLLIALQNRIDELVLNPGSVHTRRIRRETIEAIALQGDLDQPGSEWQRPSEGTTVLIAPPDETPPDGWWRTMKETLGHYLSIESAFFFQLRMAPQGPRHVIGVALYEGMTLDAQERLMGDLLEELEGMLPQGWTLDLVVLDERDFLTTVRDTVPPFYERD
jgi:hypothetical protein